MDVYYKLYPVKDKWSAGVIYPRQESFLSSVAFVLNYCLQCNFFFFLLGKGFGLYLFERHYFHSIYALQNQMGRWEKRENYWSEMKRTNAHKNGEDGVSLVHCSY